jgi:hypothetical protein
VNYEKSISPLDQIFQDNSYVIPLIISKRDADIILNKDCEIHEPNSAFLDLVTNLENEYSKELEPSLRTDLGLKVKIIDKIYE